MAEQNGLWFDRSHLLYHDYDYYQHNVWLALEMNFSMLKSLALGIAKFIFN